MTAVQTPKHRTTPEANPAEGGSSGGEEQQPGWFKRHWRGIGGMTVAVVAAGTGMYAMYRMGETNTQNAVEQGKKNAAAAATEATQQTTVAALTREFGLLGYDVTVPGNVQFRIVAVADGFNAVAVNPKLADQLTEKVGNVYSANPAAPPDLEASQVHEVINHLTGAVEAQSATQVAVIQTPKAYAALVASVVGATPAGSTPSN